MNPEIAHLSDEIYDKAVAIRREIHRHPELAFNEVNTASIITRFLKEYQIPYTDQIAQTGVVGMIRGGAPGATLLLRADMDALPLEEQTEAPYRSEASGVMHACGHDAHVATLLGTAYVLNKMRSQLSGNVKLVFQPAEEGVGGALPMIESGILESPQVDGCCALHVSPLARAGEILVKKGELTASPDDFEIRIIGKGGHGASPHTTIDPISIGCTVVNALQLIVSRMVEANTPAVLSIGYFNAGTSPNIIPDFALIGGTLRTTRPDLRQEIPKTIENIVSGITSSMGADYEFTYNYLFPPTVNDAALTDEFVASAQEVIGRENIIWQRNPSMIGEDFAYFGQHVPATLFYLGCRNDEKGACHPLHSSQFDIDEDCIRTGIHLMSHFAIDFLEKRK